MNILEILIGYTAIILTLFCFLIYVLNKTVRALSIVLREHARALRNMREINKDE